MKKLISSFLALSILVFSCETQEPASVVDLKSIAHEVNAVHTDANSNLIVSSNNEILVMSKSRSELGHYDRAFVFQHREKPDLTDMVLKEFALFESAMLVNAGNTLLFIAVDNDDNHSLLNQIRAREQATKVVPIWAYGLSTHKGSWATSIRADDVSAHNALIEYSKNRTERGKVPPVGGEPNCTSGGTGSSSCSITELFGMSCSVTCDDGYYACCDSKTTTCKCVKKVDPQ